MNDNERSNENVNPERVDPVGQDDTTRPYDAVPPESTAGATAPAASADPSTPKRRIGRPVLLGVGAGLALLLVGGVGLAIGMEIADDRDDAPSSQNGPGGHRGEHDGDRGDDRSDRHDDGRDDKSDGAPASAGGALASSDVADLNAAAKAALGMAGVTGISSIDVEIGGYDIDVLQEGGTDVEVFVSTAGEVSEPRDQDTDSTPDPALDLDRLEEIVSAATAAASSAMSGAEATVDSISTSDDRGIAFEVTLKYADGRDVDVTLATDLAVVSTDLDD